MKVPCCSVCQTRYNEEERVPLLLQCGHGFCKECLSRMFSASPDSTLPCPRCRHVSVVGNSVQALRKNYAILALLSSPASNPSAGASFDCDYTDDDDDGGGGSVDDSDDDVDGDGSRRCSRGSLASSSTATGGCGPVIEVGAHQDLKLVRRIGESRRAGVETWAALIGGRRCRHRVAVKKVGVPEDVDVDWVLGQLESLRRASMWCRNVCTFHGAMRMEGSLCLVMDRCCESVQSEMQRNEGRLTLEQILRFCFICLVWFMNEWLFLEQEVIFLY
jgi:E3 ubiquitin-protein ligase KEG